MRIVPGREADYDWAAGLMAKSEPWVTLGRDLDQCRAAVRRPGTELFIGREGEERLGFVLVAERGLAGSPYLAAIAVEEATRGRGIGSALLDFVEQRYGGSHRHLFLLVSSFNHGARRLYEARGYRQVGEIPDYIVAGHSEYIMHKLLQ